MATIELFATVTKLPDLRFSPAGKTWVTVNLAENRKAQNGTETTTWWKLKAFGQQAESLAELQKGTRLKVRGFFGTEEWAGNDGVKRTDLQVFPFPDGVEVQEGREQRGEAKHVGGQPFGWSAGGKAPQGGAADDPWATQPARPMTSEPPF